MSTSDPETNTCAQEKMKRKIQHKNGLTMTEHEPKKPKYIELNDGEECLRTLQKLLNDDLKTSPPDTELTINYAGTEPLDEVLNSIFEICDDASDVLRNVRLKGELISASSNAKKSESVENTNANQSQNSSTVAESSKSTSRDEEIVFEQLINQLKTVEGYDEEDWGKNINIGHDTFYSEKEGMSADEKEKFLLEFLEDDTSSNEDTAVPPQNFAQDSTSEHTSPVSNHHEDVNQSGSGEFFEESAYLNEGPYYPYEDNYFDIDINRLPDEMITSSFVLDYVLRDIPLNVPSSDKVSRSNSNEACSISENFQDSKPGLQATQESLENPTYNSEKSEDVKPVVPETSDHDNACEATTPLAMVKSEADSSACEGEAVAPLVLEKSDDDCAGSVQQCPSSTPEDIRDKPTPEDKVTATPEDKVTATPEDKVTPTPEDKVTPTPEDKVTATPEDKVTATPENKVTPTPEDKVTPTPEDKVTPTPEDKVTPTTEDKVTPTTEDKVTPTPEDSHEEMKQTELPFKLKPCRVFLYKLDASVLEKYNFRKEKTVKVMAPMCIEASCTSSTPARTPTLFPPKSELFRDPKFTKLLLEKWKGFKESKKKSANEKRNEEKEKSENPESAPVGKPTESPVLPGKGKVEEMKVETEQETMTSITPEIPQEAVVEKHSESIAAENATSISSPPSDEPSIPAEDSPKPESPKCAGRKRGRPKTKSKIGTAPQRTRSISKNPSGVGTEECIPIPVKNEVQETASAAELIPEAETAPDPEQTNTKYPLRTRRTRSVPWKHRNETNLKANQNQKVDYLKVMSEEVEKTDPNISLLSDAMARTFKGRKKMVDDPAKDVQQIVRKYPALRIYQVIKEEYGRMQNDLTKTESLEKNLEPLLKESLQLRMKRFGYRHPIMIQAKKIWRETKDCDPRLEQVLGMLALCFHFAENTVLTNLCRILEDNEELDDTSKLNLVTPTLVLKRSQIFETESEMWIYVETSKYLRVPNFYEGVISIYSIYYVFNLCYDNKLKALYEFFDMINGNPQSTYSQTQSLLRNSN